MVSDTALQKNLDAFYTHPKIARFCLDLLKDLIHQNLALDLNAFHFLEPSAGSGSFVDALKGLGIADCLALDIAPKAQGIQKKDYLLEWIEIKFSKNDKGEKNLQTSRPMWNSNLPKPNAIYVYGIANANITFFKGSDILSYETREVLLKYFDTLDKDEGNLKNALKDLENPFGFAPYIRKAYEHKKEFSNHHQIESFFSRNHILREQNVLEFLKTLTH